MSDKTETVLRRVRAMLERAEHPGTPKPEADSCREHAERLMAKHSIEQATLDASRQDRAKPDCLVILTAGGYGRYKATLANSIASVFSCKAIHMGKNADGDTKTYVYGFEADLDMVWTLFESLLSQMEREMFAASNSTARFRQSFILQFAGRVKERLAALYQDEVAKAEAETPGTALVLADRLPAVLGEYERNHPDARKMNLTGSDWEGLLRGHRAANDADIFLAGRRFDQDDTKELTA